MFQKNPQPEGTPVPKPAKKKKPAKKQSGLTAKSFVIPLVVALGLTGGMYFVIKAQIENKTEKVAVMYTAKDIPANTYIDQKDYSKYFTVKSTDKNFVSDDTVTNPSKLPTDGMYVKTELHKNQMVDEDDIAQGSKVMEKYKDGYVRTSIATSSFTNAINGTVRAGDIITIYGKESTTSDDTNWTCYGKDLYVEAAYNSDGTECTDDGGIATAFTVWVTPDGVDAINHAIDIGGLQLYIEHTNGDVNGADTSDASVNTDTSADSTNAVTESTSAQ
jgi:hypothetical protein